MLFGFLVSGVGMVCGLVPFKTGPLFVLVFVVPSLFSLVVRMFVGDVFSLSFSLSLSLSLSLRRWGTQTPFGVWVPLVTLHPGRALRLLPVPHAPLL